MKLYQLFENESVEFDSDKFLADCKPWLDAIKGSKNLAYRGDNEIKADVQFLKHKNYRRPLNLPRDVHDEVNDVFEEKFKWRARESGFFVVGQREKAKGFGKLGVIFPIGDFKSLWSPDILDIWESWESFYDEESDYGRNSYEDDEKYYGKKFAEHLVKNLTWHYNEKVKECLNNSISELIISANSYYAFDVESKLWTDTLVPLLKSKDIG